MANVHIGSNYTITDVNMCNTASDAQVWYQVSFHQDSYVYEQWGKYFEIVEIGNHDKLIESNGLYKKLYKLQLEGNNE